MSFFEVFVEMFNVTAALVIISFCGYFLFKAYKMDRSLLRAKLFLNETITQQNWLYLSIAGAAFALNALIKLVGRFFVMGDTLYDYYLVELTQVIFIVAFIHAVYSWTLFINKNGQPVISR